MGHPVENDLALLAGGETGRARRFWLERHVSGCERCQSRVSEYAVLRSEMAGVDELPELNWNFLAGEMRANIRLGLEAGACVRTTTHISKRWNPRLSIAFASVLVLVGTSLVVRVRPWLHEKPAAEVSSAPVLESSGSGVEFRTEGNSLTLLNHRGDATNQTVSAQGDVQTRYIDSETSSVTINDVYLQ